MTLPLNQIILGDCIEVMRDLPDACVDFVLTDPPYFCNDVDRLGRKVANDNCRDWLDPFAGSGLRQKAEAEANYWRELAVSDTSTEVSTQTNRPP